MAGLGPLEIIGIIVLVILLFGVGRISKIGGEMGKGIRAFKDGLQGGESETKESEASTPEDADKNNSQ